MFWNRKPEEVTFDTIKAAFPNATYVNGILTLPTTSYDELKKKFSNATPETLRSKFFYVAFGKMGPIDIKEIKTAFPDASDANKKLTLPTANLNDFLNKFPDANISGLKAKFGDVAFASKPEDLSYATLKELFPNTRYENNKLILPDASFKDLKAKFTTLTAASLKAKFPNVEFGKMSDYTFDDIKAEFYTASMTNNKLTIPGITFTDFQNKFPDATLNGLAAKFPGYTFGTVAPATPTPAPAPAATATTVRPPVTTPVTPASTVPPASTVNTTIRPPVTPSPVTPSPVTPVYAPAAAPNPNKRPDSDIANEVIQGKWGNDPERSNKLIAAGYDPKAIQALVNQKLQGTASASSKKSDDEIANEVIQGKWGNEPDRSNRLRAAGYDPRTIQALVNQKFR
ncbi:MAG: hypothetical protein FWC47_17485 [Oscillospiraceae bacterium]|nr:hypothetical protein [Oscillospiraceae bacterium]